MRKNKNPRRMILISRGIKLNAISIPQSSSITIQDGSFLFRSFSTLPETKKPALSKSKRAIKQFTTWPFKIMNNPTPARLPNVPGIKGR